MLEVIGLRCRESLDTHKCIVFYYCNLYWHRYVSCFLATPFNIWPAECQRVPLCSKKYLLLELYLLINYCFHITSFQLKFTLFKDVGWVVGICNVSVCALSLGKRVYTWSCNLLLLLNINPAMVILWLKIKKYTLSALRAIVLCIATNVYGGLCP